MSPLLLILILLLLFGGGGGYYAHGPYGGIGIGGIVLIILIVLLLTGRLSMRPPYVLISRKCREPKARLL